jgi:hypothetical protein
MKIRVGLFVIASVAFVSIGTSAQAANCVVTNFTLQVLGQTKTPTGSPCSAAGETASGSELGSSGSATITMSDGTVHENLQNTNAANAEINGNVTSTVAATLPSNFTLGKISGTFDLTSVSLVETDTARVSMTTPNQATLGKAFFGVSNTILDMFATGLFGKATFALAPLGITTTEQNTPGTTFSCLSPTACTSASIAIGDQVKFNGLASALSAGAALNGIDFTLNVSLDTQLATGGGANSSTIDAKDPVTFELLDANGLVIPGVTFVADDGFVFGGPEAATPLPATLPLFATGIGALGLLGWRRKRKGQAVA